MDYIEKARLLAEHAARRQVAEAQLSAVSAQYLQTDVIPPPPDALWSEARWRNAVKLYASLSLERAASNVQKQNEEWESED